MKKTLFLLVSFILVLNSCIKEPYETTGLYIIKNNSSQKIKINIYNNTIISDSFVLYDAEIKEYKLSGRGGVSTPPPFSGDSVVVCYGDNIKITHLRIDNINIPKNNIYYTKSWTGGQVSKYEYKYEYIFTNEDYQEAIDNQ